MSDSDLILLQSIRTNLEQAKLVSQNVSNASTPGYKSIVGEVNEFSNLLGLNNISTQLHSEMLLTKKVKMEASSIKSTERSLDLMVDFPGFFEIETNGIKHLASSQRFELNRDNIIVTHQGGVLQGVNGAIAINSENFKSIIFFYHRLLHVSYLAFGLVVSKRDSRVCQLVVLTYTCIYIKTLLL